MGLWNMIKKSKKKKEESRLDQISEPNVSAIDATSETICGNVVPKITESDRNFHHLQTSNTSSSSSYYNRTSNSNSFKASLLSNKKNEYDHQDLSPFPRSKSYKGPKLQAFDDNFMTAETLDCPVSSPEISKLPNRKETSTEISNNSEGTSSSSSSTTEHKLNQMKLIDKSPTEETLPYYVASSNVYKIPRKEKNIIPHQAVVQEDSSFSSSVNQSSFNQSTSINNESIQRPPSPTPVDITTDRERIGSFQTDEESFVNSTILPAAVVTNDSSQKFEESFIQQNDTIEETHIEKEYFTSPEVTYKKAINETEIVNMENEVNREYLPIENVEYTQPEISHKIDPEEPSYFELHQSSYLEDQMDVEEEMIEEQPKFENNNQDNFDLYLDDEDPEISSDEEDTEPQYPTMEEVHESESDHQEDSPIPQQLNISPPREEKRLPPKISPPSKKSGYFVEEENTPEQDSNISIYEDERKCTNSPSQELAQLEHKELTMFLESELTKLKDDLKKDSQIEKGVASKDISNLPPPESLPVSSQQQPLSLTLNLDAKYKYARKALLRQYFKDRNSSKEMITDEFAKIGQPIDLDTSLKLERWDKENRELDRLKASRRKYEKDLEKLEKLVEIEQMEHDVELSKSKSHVVSKTNNKQVDLKSKKGYSQLLHSKMEYMGKTLVSSSDNTKEGDEPVVLIKQISLLKSEREKYQSLVEKQKEVIKTLTEDLLDDGEFSPKEKLQIIDNIMRHAPILHDETTKEMYMPPFELDDNGHTLEGADVEPNNSQPHFENDLKPEKLKKKKNKKMTKSATAAEEQPSSVRASSSKKKSNTAVNTNYNQELQDVKRSLSPKMNAAKRPSSASSVSRRTLSSSLSEPMYNTTTENRRTIIRPTSPSLTKRPSSSAGTRKITIALEPTRSSDCSDRKTTRPGSASSTRCDKIVDRLYEGGMEKQTKAREWASNQRKLQEAKVMQEVREKPILNRNTIGIINRKSISSEAFRDMDSPVVESLRRTSGSISGSGREFASSFGNSNFQSAGSLEEMKLMRQDTRRRRVKEYYLMKESMAECTFTPNLSKKTNELISQKRSKEEVHKQLYQDAKDKEAHNAELRKVAVNMREEEEQKQLTKPKTWKNPEEEQAFINRMLEAGKIKQKKMEELRGRVFEKENPFKPQINENDIQDRSDICEHLYKQGREVQKRRQFIKEQYDQYLESIAATKHTNRESTKYIQSMKEKRIFSLFNLFCIESNSDNMQVGKLHSVIEPLLEKFGSPIAMVVPLLEYTFGDKAVLNYDQFRTFLSSSEASLNLVDLANQIKLLQNQIELQLAIENRDLQFTPHISEESRKLDPFEGENFQDRVDNMMAYKEVRDQKIQMLRNGLIQKELKECTFNPRINSVNKK